MRYILLWLLLCGVVTGQTVPELKETFSANARPTESDFADLINRLAEGTHKLAQASHPSTTDDDWQEGDTYVYTPDGCLYEYQADGTTELLSAISYGATSPGYPASRTAPGLHIAADGTVYQFDGATYTQMDSAVNTARHRANKASLAATAGVDGEAVFLYGDTTAGDSGAPWVMIYHATGRPTADGGFYLDGPGADDFWEAADKSIAYPDRFGAKGGDASFDSRAAIQAAMDSTAIHVVWGAKKVYWIKSLMAGEGQKAGLQITHAHNGKTFDGQGCTLQASAGITTTTPNSMLLVTTVVGETTNCQDITIRNFVIDTDNDNQADRFDGYTEFENANDVDNVWLKDITVSNIRCEDCYQAFAVRAHLSQHRDLSAKRCYSGLGINQRRNYAGTPNDVPYAMDVDGVRIEDGGAGFSFDASSPGGAGAGTTDYTARVRNLTVIDSGQIKTQENVKLFLDGVHANGCPLIKFGDADYVHMTNFRLTNVANSTGDGHAITCELAKHVTLSHGWIDNSSQEQPTYAAVKLNSVAGEIRDVVIDGSDSTAALLIQTTDPAIVSGVTIKNASNDDYPLKSYTKTTFTKIKFEDTTYAYNAFNYAGSAGSQWQNCTFDKPMYLQADNHRFDECDWSASSGDSLRGLTTVRPVYSQNNIDISGDSNISFVASSGDALVANPLSQFAATTSAQFEGVISDETGSGLVVLATSPTLTTPALGTPSAAVLTNATGTAAGLTAGSVTTNANLTGHITSTGNAAILGSFTLAQLNTAVSDSTFDTMSTQASSSVAITGGSVTGITDVTIADGGTGASTAQAAIDTLTAVAGATNEYVLTKDTASGNAIFKASTGSGDALVANPLSQFAATTSAQLAGVLSDETGSGLAVFGTSPTLTTPVLGIATATSINKVAFTAPATGSTLTIAEGATLTASASATVNGTNTGDQTITLTGDVTGTGTGSFAATIASDTVTYDKMQDVTATDLILGRSTAGSGTVEEIACTSAGRALLDDASASAQRTTLGLGTIATQAANSVAITGGSVTGITDVAIADGGTGASTAQAAIDLLTAVSGATDEYVLTKDTATGNAVFKAAAGGGGGPSTPGTTTDTALVVWDSTDGTSVADSGILLASDNLTFPNNKQITIPGGGAEVRIGNGFHRFHHYGLELEDSGHVSWATGNGAGTQDLILSNGGVGLLAIESITAGTNGVQNAMTVSQNTTGTVATGFGSGLVFQLETTPTENQDAASIAALWDDATHASRSGDLVLSAFEQGNAREGIRIRGGSTAELGFFTATPVAQPSGTGETTGFTAGAGTGVNDDSTFTGNIGSTAYRVNDVVKALKQLGVLAE